MTNWYSPLAAHVSLGATRERPGSLAGLAKARKENLGQFFTPESLAFLMWSIATRSNDGPECCLSVLDNSVGSARLLQFCKPGMHHIAGVDIHEDVITQVRTVAEAAGFSCEFMHAGMESIHPKGYSIGLINPPFSINLQAPTLQPYLCTTWGKFGANTSAPSHFYALAQALEACSVVVAVLPRNAALQVLNEGEDLLGAHRGRLAAVIELPSGTFREEGTDVATSLVVFDSQRWSKVGTFKLSTLGLPDNYFVRLTIPAPSRAGRLHPIGLEASEPSIHTPVTLDSTVRVVHDGRKIKLRFACGLTEAKVMNALLRSHAREHRSAEERLPAKVKYAGQGWFDVEAYLTQKDPHGAFSDFLREIEVAGGTPIVDLGLQRYFGKRVRQSARERTPLRHEVWMPSVVHEQFDAIAKATFLVDLGSWCSPVIKAGQSVTFHQDGEHWLFQAGRLQLSYSMEEIEAHFTVPEINPGWVVVNEGLNVAFPEQSKMWKKRIAGAAINEWLSWDFQQDDLAEFMMCPTGAVCGWEMGLGKSRLAYAMILLSGVKHGLIVTEAYLVPEIVRILQEQLPIESNQWQVIDCAEKLDELSRINVISTTMLRSHVYPDRVRKAVDRKGNEVTKGPRVTFAHKLRGRIGLAIVDEGELLSNPNSQRSIAIWRLRAKRLFVLTGTPIPNYPRNAHPILAAVAGNATSAQPYGLREAPFMDEDFLCKAAYSKRGVDKFRDDFVTTEWVTREFEDDMERGAKREVPKLRNLPEYRSWLSRHIKRRLLREPDVARFISVKDPVERPVQQVEWDPEHLAYYLAVADDFAQWWKETRSQDGRRNNLVALLARINAVVDACNIPQRGQGNRIPFAGLTSKQRWIVDRLEALSREGHKTIVYCQNPENAELFARELSCRNVEAVTFHGGLSITKRTQVLKNRFRNGSASVLSATKGCTQAGLNIPEADYVVFYDRAWMAKTERQAIRRAVRPEQTRVVTVERVHLRGSIDDYMGQMCAFKADIADAGLDWATPELDEVEFLHLDRILDGFVEALANMRGMKPYDYREILKEAA